MTIKSKLVISSTLFIIIAVMLMWAGFSINIERQNNLTFINYAGQLRFRSYRLAWLINEHRRHAAQRAEFETKIKKDMGEFEGILSALKNGSNKYDIRGIEDKEILSRLNKHIEDWNKIKPMIEHIVKFPDLNVHGAHEEQTEDYVDEIHATVNLFESKKKAEMQTFIFMTYLVAILSMSLFFTFLFYIYRQIVIPLGIMVKGMKEFSNGNLKARVDIIAKDEIGAAASTFNSMAEKIENMYARLGSAVDQLCDANYKLEKAARLKSMALPILSHELKTPLTSIKGFVHTLLREDARLSETVQKKYLATINSDADRLLRLINEMLDMTMIELNRVKLDLKPLFISTIVRDVSERLNTAIFGLDLQDGIPEILLDKNKIEQVILNLIDNAIKYSPDRCPIKINAKDEWEFIKVTVEDEGIGIPKSDREKVFDAFYRIDSDPQLKHLGASLSKSVHGLGLGLFICKGIIEAHKGRIWIEEKEGNGTRVAFTLPKG